jgi:hypothetical protein
MNSYNENLHSSVLSSLESQEMTKKQLSTQLNASMFTLYYAEGAEIVAQENLESTTRLYKEKQLINTVVVKNKNMADNLLLSANQQKTYTTQSVTNMAICASNIQIASNSIVRLASDVGSIYSIINAADYGTQIYQQASEAYNLINITAYNAEETSQHAMEASASIAEVATSTVADQANLTNTSVNNLLQVTTADLASITTVLTADNDIKSKASIATRAAEGAIKCSMVEYDASNKAYQFNNEKFNQNLNVEVPTPFDVDNGNFTVTFNYYKSPFSSEDSNSETQRLVSDKPVQNYNIILVKDSKKSIFNVSSAENLLTNPSQYKRVPVPNAPLKTGTSVNIRINELLDSDNEPLTLGQDYVAFLLIIFTENYKKEINTFDEYLSAPTETFTFTQTLNNADGITVARETGSTELSKIKFTVEKETDLKASEVDYRCLLLPYSDDLLSTNEDLSTLEYKIETRELLEEIKMLEEEINALNGEIQNINTGASEVASDKTKSIKEQEVAKQKNNNFKNALNNANAKLNIANEELKKLKAELAETEKNYPKPVKNKNAFYFNLNLAENISAGNYTSAKPQKASLFVAEIDTTTTDNFGNPLVEDKKYIPVVLSYYNGTEANKSKYTNSLSDWENTTPFTYSTSTAQQTTTN